ncbi:hypothetical protein [Streptomyces cinereoruber]|uniref:hypothetical protein n=1 Tax=Streptomyces cinereoruber TaxID=67260 RepID=UPI00362A8C41
MEHTKQLAELARCIEEHNTLTSQAHDLWRRAQAEGRRIGQLVEAALSTGVSWTELGTLLSGIDEAPPPAGLAAGLPSDVAPATEPSMHEEETDARLLVPAQSAGITPGAPAGELVPEGIPVLLFQAYSVVSASAEQEMATRDLAVALGRNPNTLGPELCALLREVGVERSDGGRIKARYEGTGKRLPGFTAVCLKRALDAHAARTSGAPAPPA